MSYIKFSPVSATHGFAVEKMQKVWNVIFVRKEQDKDGKDVLIKEATAYDNGKAHSYSSPFIADHVIRTLLLPMYKKPAGA